MPINSLPHWLQRIAPVWPTYHLSQIALGGIGFGMRGALGGHIAALAGFTIAFLALAAILFRRNASKG
jgi:ABC-2 type transport system permease protein